MQFTIEIVDAPKLTALSRARAAYNVAHSTSLTDEQYLQLVCDQTVAGYVPVYTVSTLTKYQFLDRFTQAERVAIRAAAANNATLYDFMQMLEISGEVILSNPNTSAGVTMLEAVGLLAAGRAAQILAV